MEGVVSAIIIGAVIIAWAISSLKSNDDNDDNDYPYIPTSSELRAIESGLKDGFLPNEIFKENANYFKSEDDVNENIKKYGMEDKFKELEELRKQNPNFVLELSIANLSNEIEGSKKQIKEWEEDLALAKETHNFDEAKTNRDLIKYQQRTLDFNIEKLKKLKEELHKKNKTQ